MRRKNSHKLIIVMLVLLLIAAGAGYGYYALKRPLADIKPVMATTSLQAAAGTSQVAWPSSGQAAVAILGTDILETHAAQTSVPIASTAKVITALTVLQKYPLAAGQQGPLITLTDSDVALYNAYVAQEGSVVPVITGEQISEYQILEAMMLPSANNMADTLATWAYGSLSGYTTAGQAYVTKLGLKDTHIGTDASGFSPTTTSTAHDLVVIGEQAMQNPVLAAIVNEQSTSDVPDASLLHNVNVLLGIDNIIGIKTGNTDQAGGVFLSASKTTVNNKPVIIVTSLVGAPSIYDALNNSLPFIASTQTNFADVDVLAAKAGIGEYKQPWDGILSAATETDLSSQVWRGDTLHAVASLQPISPNAKAGTVVGTVSSGKTAVGEATTTNIVLQQAATKPSVLWRLLHP